MSTSLGYNINRNPIAQSFYVDEPSGCYVTKVEAFFKSKSTADPVMLQLRPMVNGFPSTSETIPSSTVYVNQANINTSNDASLSTEFRFDEPVYLRGLKDYAIVITTTSADYEIYIAQIDEYVVGTTASRVNRNPALGSLFYSASGGTFSAAQHQDLTFKLHVARFKHTSGQISLKNAPLPKRLLVPDPIRTTSGSTTITVSHPGHGFLVNDKVTISGVDSSSTIGAITGANINGNRTITAVDFSGYQVAAGSAADSDDIGGGINVLATKQIPYSVAYINQQSIIPQETEIFTGFKGTTGKSFAGTETAYVKDGSFTTLEPNNTIRLNRALVVANEQQETTNSITNKSLEMALKLFTDNTLVAPMVDLQRASATLVDFQIDKQDSSATTGFNVPLNMVLETDSKAGSAASKHITKPITLVEPAVGLKILFAANRQPGSDIQVFFRTATEDENIRDKGFTLQAEETNNGTDDQRSLFRDYTYLAGGTTGTLEEFTKFQVKLVMRSTNRAKVPTITDLRVIAMSV